MTSKNQLRDQEIFALWSVQKMTFAAIGRRFELSRERIRQIVRKQQSGRV